MEKGSWFWFSIAFSCHRWGPLHLIPTPTTCYHCSRSSSQDKPGSSAQISTWWWQTRAVLPGGQWVVHLLSSPAACCSGLLALPCLFPAPQLESLCLKQGFWVKRVQSESSLISLWLSSHQETEGPCLNKQWMGWRPHPPAPCRSARAPSELQGRIAPGTNPKPFTLQSK